MKNTILIYARAVRVNQWIKNSVVFCAILFSGRLLEPDLFISSIYAFFIFCLLSSTSYILNDVIDYSYDKKHPIKQFRPIASGQISIPQATFIVFTFTIISLLLALQYSIPFFLLALLFILLHFFYSLYLKKYPVVDIFIISFSFMIRTFAGVVVTGTHLPIWLMFTIFFVSLFMATVKRHAELVTQGKGGTRVSLYRYKEHLLYFLSTTFAALTIISYANFAYLSDDSYIVHRCPLNPQLTAQSKPNECPKIALVEYIYSFNPDFEGRKLMMITIPLAVYGIARYAQLLYEREEGERPEKIITTDKPLVVTIFLWAISIITLIYIL